MKSILKSVVCISVCFCLCTGCSDINKDQHMVDAFGWLSGNRVDTAIGFYESWSISGDTMLIGEGFQVAGIDTIFSESLSIRKINKIWSYNVCFENEETIFPNVNQTDDSLVFYNSQNEFPKRIIYINRGNGYMDVIIDNPDEPDKTTRFNFIPLK